MRKSLVATSIVGAILTGIVSSALWDLGKANLYVILSTFTEAFPDSWPLSDARAFRTASQHSSAELRLRAGLPAFAMAGSLLLFILHGILYIAHRRHPLELAAHVTRLPNGAHLSLALLNAFVLAWCLVQTYEWTQAAKIGRSFENRLRVCRPFMTEHDVHLAVRRYALMQAPSDFSALMSAMPCKE